MILPLLASILLINACAPAQHEVANGWKSEAPVETVRPDVEMSTLTKCNVALVFVHDHIQEIRSAYKVDMTDATRPVLEPLADGIYTNADCTYQIRYQQYYCPNDIWRGGCN